MIAESFSYAVKLANSTPMCLLTSSWSSVVHIGDPVLESVRGLNIYTNINLSLTLLLIKMRIVTYTQILSILCSSIGLIFHLKAVLREKDSSEKDENDRKIARRSTLLSILFLGLTYGLILYNWDGYPSPKHEVQINFFHIMIVLLPITIIELLVAHEIL
jgi:cytochrome bd-type quinol oxidase subunit 2